MKTKPKTKVKRRNLSEWVLNFEKDAFFNYPMGEEQRDFLSTIIKKSSKIRKKFYKNYLPDFSRTLNVPSSKSHYKYENFFIETTPISKKVKTIKEKNDSNEKYWIKKKNFKNKHTKQGDNEDEYEYKDENEYENEDENKDENEDENENKFEIKDENEEEEKEEESEEEKEEYDYIPSKTYQLGSKSAKFDKKSKNFVTLRVKKNKKIKRYYK